MIMVFSLILTKVLIGETNTLRYADGGLVERNVDSNLLHGQRLNSQQSYNDRTLLAISDDLLLVIVMQQMCHLLY